MFTLVNSDGNLIMFRCCECDETIFLEKHQLKTITPDYVILDDNTEITCEKCGISHPKSEKFISLEPQYISCDFQTAPESNLPFWMTRDITTEELMRTIIFD